MSEFQNIPVGKQAQEMDISPQFQPYSGVEIIVDEENSIFAGNKSGRVLRFENPWGTQEQANDILASLTQSGFRYQPYTAKNALVNPAAELGDAVTVNGEYSGIYKLSRNYSSLMAADIEAPQDEEVDHEFPYEPKQDRIYKREIADARAAISLTQEQISTEVSRATSAEESLSSAIRQTSTEINANVVKRTGGSTSTFGWTLNSSSWTLSSNGSTVFKCDSSGVQISGKVTAKSGSIGGFTIGSSAIYNGMSSISSTANGVYIGTNGISVGGGKFKVTSSGAVSAANMTLTGTLNIGGTNITAAALRSGAQSAYTNGSTWTTGSGYGYNYNNATKSGTTSYPSYFTCGSLKTNNLTVTNTISSLSVTSLSIRGTIAFWREIKDYYGNERTVLMPAVG